MHNHLFSLGYHGLDQCFCLNVSLCFPQVLQLLGEGVRDAVNVGTHVVDLVAYCCQARGNTIGRGYGRQLDLQLQLLREEVHSHCCARQVGLCVS